MKTLKDILEASLLDDIEDTLSDGDVKVPRALVLEYLKDNYRGTWIVSKKPDKDGLYEVSSNENIKVKNTKITSLTNDLFIWTSVKGNFNCSYCEKLKTLEGAPEIVKGNFDCVGCNSLKTLEGAPKEIGNSFDCSYCEELISLKGSSKEIKGTFNCSFCNSLKTLDGSPEEVGHDFYCRNCKSLESLDDFPKIIKGDFYCSNCGKLFTTNDIKKVVLKIKGDIYC